MTAATAIRFRSVDRPELVLTEDDVSLCDACGNLSTAENEAATREFGPCATCQDYRLVHGYTQGGRGLPVEVAERGVDLHALYRERRRA